jgi:hypothetical protein
VSATGHRGWGPRGNDAIPRSSATREIQSRSRRTREVPDGEVEIRKLMDVEDFGEGFTPNPEIAKVKFK